MSTPLQQAAAVVAAEAKRAAKIERAARDVVEVYAHRKHLGEAEVADIIKALAKALK